MPKYDLTITSSYVQGWVFTDAIRELFQNALDQEATVPNNEMFFNYVPETQTLSIGNKSSVLERKSLLLGASTKQDDDKTIGRFGEGYKVAVLVLLRLGKGIKFYNYGAKEVWMPYMKKSRAFKTDLLCFDIQKKAIWDSVPDYNLTIEVTGVTSDEYAEVVEKTLQLQGEYKSIPSAKGEVLLSSDHKGKIFVNGLFVCLHEPYRRGYNFKPQYLKLDRDRKLVSDFELRWLASEVWLGVDGHEDEIARLVDMTAPDVAYIHLASAPTFTRKEEIANKVAKAFTEEFGTAAVPVTSNEELQAARSTGEKAVMVSEQKQALLRSSSLVPIKQPPKVATVREQLEDWLDRHEQSLSRKAKAELASIMERL